MLDESPDTTFKAFTATFIQITILIFSTYMIIFYVIRS